MVARFDPASYFVDQPTFLTSWGWQSGWLYVGLKSGSDAAAIEAQFPAWEKRNIPDEIYGEQRFNQGDQAEFHLVNIEDVHLGLGQAAAMTPGNENGRAAGRERGGQDVEDAVVT